MTIVGEAADGADAFDLALRERPDIVITDLVMPRLNGVELTRRIRQELPETKIIVVSSYPEDTYRHMASDSGADAFVSKQVMARSLLPAIHGIVQHPFRRSDPFPPSGRRRGIIRFGSAASVNQPLPGAMGSYAPAG